MVSFNTGCKITTFLGDMQDFTQKKCRFFAYFKKKQYFCRRFRRKDGRVVYCVGLENRSTERYRGFESLSFRTFPKYTIVKISLPR